MRKTSNSYHLPFNGLPPVDDEKPINWGQLFRGYLRYWPVIMLCTLLGGVASYIYLKYKSPVHSAVTKLLIKDENSSGQLTEAAVFEDLGLSTRTGNMENEMEILQSVSLMRDVVERLSLQHLYIRKGRIRDVDVYRDCPFRLRAWVPNDSLADAHLSFRARAIDERRYEVEVKGGRFQGEFGRPLTLQGKGSLVLDWRSKPDPVKGGDAYIIVTRSSEEAAASMAGRLEIKSIGKRSTVLEIRLQDEVAQRAKDVLDELVRVYNRTQLEDKNRIYRNTIVFIDNRLKGLTGELSDVESGVERYKSQNRLVDVGTQGELLLERNSEYAKTVTDAEIQLDILGGIREVLQKDQDRFDFIPSNVGITNLTLTGMLERFNAILLERDKADAVLGARNPQVVSLERQLASLRTNILRNIEGLERDLHTTRDAIAGRNRQLETRIRSLPGQERRLVEIQRQQTIKQNLYLYLLQKREESELSLSVAVGNTRVVEPARDGGQVSPNRRNIWALGFGAGLLLPLAVISILRAVNTRVRHAEDIKRQTRVPILGMVNYSHKPYPVAVNGKSRTAVTEMFRLIRANLQFIGNGEHNRVIMVTSSQSGEGKTFVSLNLAATLAMAGKRVLLMELDMRNPGLARMLRHRQEGQQGITRYLVGGIPDWRDVIQGSAFNPSLDILFCGPIPPNPSELIMGGRMEALLEDVRREYDYVIVDTAPVGLVSDALLLNRYIDATLYVVRRDVTRISQLEIVEEAAVQGKLPRPYIILNAVRNDFMAYGKGYHNGYGYYRDEEGLKDRIRSIWRRAEVPHPHQEADTPERMKNGEGWR